MEYLALFERLGLAVAIGAMIGVERHWRERDVPEGQRTAGLRTFTLIGMLGGVAAFLERDLAAGALPTGLILATFFAVLIGAFTLFQYRETQASGTFGVTTVVAAMLTYGLGALAVLGDMELASAAGVVLLAILASREFLHQAMRALLWTELRSAIILLALAFVALPLLPSEAMGPFGGVSPSHTLMLVIILAGISFCGYVAVKLFGASRGELLAGAIGGLVSSTAVAITNARRSRQGGYSAEALAAGAIAAGAVSFLRTAVLVGTLGAALIPALVPALLAGAAVMGGYALLLFRKGGDGQGEPVQRNPFELLAVIKMALLLVVVAFLAQAASALFGSGGLFLVSALSGLVDIDAVTVTVAGLLGSLTIGVAAQAIGLAVLSNMVAKSAYAVVLGAGSLRMHFCLASLAGTAAAGLVLILSLG